MTVFALLGMQLFAGGCGSDEGSRYHFDDFGNALLAGVLAHHADWTRGSLAQPVPYYSLGLSSNFATADETPPGWWSASAGFAAAEGHEGKYVLGSRGRFYRERTHALLNAAAWLNEPLRAALATALASSLASSSSSAIASTVFEGAYIDPNHPHCPRAVDANGVITGIDPVPFREGAGCRGYKKKNEARPISHWSPYDRVGVVNYIPLGLYYRFSPPTPRFLSPTSTPFDSSI